MKEIPVQSNRPISKWLLSLVLLLAALLSVTPFVDQRAAADYEQLFQRAFITFALARTINGVISAVQGTEVALQPAGVGLTLTPGEILDPVNDLVERFSWIMLGCHHFTGCAECVAGYKRMVGHTGPGRRVRCMVVDTIMVSGAGRTGVQGVIETGFPVAAVYSFCRSRDADRQRSAVSAVS